MALPVFGHVGSYRPGDTFRNRIEMSLNGVHRPRRAGVCGTQQLGAESIVLAGQYEDDDFGEEEIRYSGNGGRDPKTGRQITDQVATTGILALLQSVESARPVRVFRKTPALDEGPDVYRYEGLYRVVGSSFGPGKSGFNVYGFRLRPYFPAEGAEMLVDDAEVRRASASSAKSSAPSAGKN